MAPNRCVANTGKVATQRRYRASLRRYGSKQQAQDGKCQPQDIAPELREASLLCIFNHKTIRFLLTCCKMV